MKKIAEKLNYIFKNSKLTWDDIEKAGINRRTFALTLKEPEHRTLETLKRICDVLGITLRDLFCDEKQLNYFHFF